MSPEQTLKLREAWKYENIRNVLNSLNISHEFEYRLKGGYIYDLALFDKKVFVEFDARYHDQEKQQSIDDEKDKFAQCYGWSVVRIKTPTNCVIDAASVENILTTRV